ncbi:SLC13 family permease [Hespellia stercorisuis]|uniref:Sodium-dependent dicarboxylate transporter SdcS n=1 Tax=Hespellia stercorisuis DSM 15480 TaxID=1121950 RepID=A0A1M6VDY8_9FIRM|nr:DASS family sodium-coupled anion symporter [Hespellia stercorisuis]SHK79591.1 anion transporter [Hespellia stercorisuis DSM 15480]
MSVKKKSGFIIAPIVFVIVMLLPEINGLPAEGKRCLAVFAAAFVLYLAESMPAAIVSLAIVPLLVVCKVTDIKSALSGFSSTSTYLIVGSFILAAAMEKSKLGDRVTYFIMQKVGTSAKRITFGIVLVNIILALLVPSSTARTAMMLPICLNIISQFRGEKKEKTKFGANLLLTLCCTNSTISAGILTATITNPMAVDYLYEATGKRVTYGEWFVWGFLPALLLTLIAWALIQLLLRPEMKELPNGKEYISQKVAEQGAPSRDEKKVGIIFLMTIVVWAFGEKIGIDSTTTCLLSAVVLCLPKIGILDWKDCADHISLSVVFICSGGISLGAAMSSTGASEWMAEKMFDILHLEGLSVAAIIILLLIVVQFMHVFFVGTATMANVFFPILIGIANVSNINATWVLIPAAMMLGGYPILMFFNTTPSILCFDTGELGADEFPKFGLILSVIACAVYALCIKFYWPLVGMM